MVDQLHRFNDPDPILSPEDAARFLNSTPASLKQARHTGLLFGKPSPKFVKMGRSTKYRLSTLMSFRDQFEEYRNTSEVYEALRSHEKLPVIPVPLMSKPIRKEKLASTARRPVIPLAQITTSAEQEQKQKQSQRSRMNFRQAKAEAGYIGGRPI